MHVLCGTDRMRGPVGAMSISLLGLPGRRGLLKSRKRGDSGTTYSSRIKYQLLCGSLVLANEPRLSLQWPFSVGLRGFIEWWTHLLLPGVHYAPAAC